MTQKLKFRAYINWDKYGLLWSENLLIPYILINYFFGKEELEDNDKVILLRIYSFLQYGDPDAQKQIAPLVERLKNQEMVNISEDGTVDLMPLYLDMLSRDKSITLQKKQYQAFIEGELMSFVFPAFFLDVLKHMRLHTKDFHQKNITVKFIMDFLYQLVTENGERFISEEYYVDDKKLVADRNHLLYAIAKTCHDLENDWNIIVEIGSLTETGVKVGGKGVSEIIDSGHNSTKATLRSDDDPIDEATRMYHLHKGGKTNADTIPDETFRLWRVHWRRMMGEFNLSIEDILNCLPVVFTTRSYVPAPNSKPKLDNLMNTSLGRMILAVKENAGGKVKKRDVRDDDLTL